MAVVLFMVVWAALLVLWVVSVVFAAEHKTVRGGDGQDYDVVVNPDGVLLYGQVVGWLNLLGGLPALVGLVRRRRGRAGWLVRVRAHPWRRNPDLYHQELPNRAAAMERQGELVEEIRRGPAPSPAG